MEKWKTFEESVLAWLAGTATGSVVKVALGAALAWLAANLSEGSLPPIVLVAITAAIPTVINALNPADPRYGAGKSDPGITFVPDGWDE